MGTKKKNQVKINITLVSGCRAQLERRRKQGIAVSLWVVSLCPKTG